MSMVRCEECADVFDSDVDCDCFSEHGTLCVICREAHEEVIDPFQDRSANIIRVLYQLKADTEDEEMRAALLADLEEYDQLLTRIQLALSTLTPPKFRMVRNG